MLGLLVGGDDDDGLHGCSWAVAVAVGWRCGDGAGRGRVDAVEQVDVLGVDGGDRVVAGVDDRAGWRRRRVPSSRRRSEVTSQVGARAAAEDASRAVRWGSRVLIGRLHRYSYGEGSPAARLTWASPYSVVRVSPGCGDGADRGADVLPVGVGGLHGGHGQPAALRAHEGDGRARGQGAGGRAGAGGGETDADRQRQRRARPGSAASSRRRGRPRRRRTAAVAARASEDGVAAAGRAGSRRAADGEQGEPAREPGERRCGPASGGVAAAARGQHLGRVQPERVHRVRDAARARCRARPSRRATARAGGGAQPAPTEPRRGPRARGVRRRATRRRAARARRPRRRPCSA